MKKFTVNNQYRKHIGKHVNWADDKQKNQLPFDDQVKLLASQPGLHSRNVTRHNVANLTLLAMIYLTNVQNSSLSAASSTPNPRALAFNDKGGNVNFKAPKPDFPSHKNRLSHRPFPVERGKSGTMIDIKKRGIIRNLSDFSNETRERARTKTESHSLSFPQAEAMSVKAHTHPDRNIIRSSLIDCLKNSATAVAQQHAQVAVAEKIYPTAVRLSHRPKRLLHGLPPRLRTSLRR